MSDTLNIRLPNHDNYAVGIPKHQFLQMFPTGLIAQALDLNPSAEEIDITQPFVTPEILDFLSSLVNNQTIPATFPSNLANLGRTGHYLGIDLLSAVANPLYSQWVITNPAFAGPLAGASAPANLLNPLSLDTYYSPAMIWAIRLKYPEMFRYLIDNTQPHPEVDDMLLPLAVLNGFNEGVRLLLQRRKVDPMTAKVDKKTVLSVFPEKRGNSDLNALLKYRSISKSFLFSLLNDISVFNLLAPYLHDVSKDYLRIALEAKRMDIATQLLESGLVNISAGSLKSYFQGYEKLTPELVTLFLNYTTAKKKGMISAVEAFIRSHLSEPLHSLHTLAEFYQNYPRYADIFRLIASHPKSPQEIRNLYTAFYNTTIGNLDATQKYIPPNEYTLLFLLRTAVRYNQFHVYAYLLNLFQHTYPTVSVAINLLPVAVYNNRIDIVRDLLTQPSISHMEGYYLRELYQFAEQHGYQDIAQLIQIRIGRGRSYQVPSLPVL